MHEEDPNSSTSWKDQNGESEETNQRKRSEDEEEEIINVNDTSPEGSPAKLERQDEQAVEQPVTQITTSPSNLFIDTSKDLISSLTKWDWVTIDGLQLPAVTRHEERYVAVHMVQLKLLSKFRPDVPREILHKCTMGSHKMSVSEAWTFNAINATIRKFDLGCQIFTHEDELVKLNDAQIFYWNVKLVNLIRIRAQYERNIEAAGDESNFQLLATISVLKKQVDNDIQAVQAELDRREKEQALRELSTIPYEFPRISGNLINDGLPATKTPQLIMSRN